jgi:hypothetical protein
MQFGGEPELYKSYQAQAKGKTIIKIVFNAPEANNGTR